MGSSQPKFHFVNKDASSASLSRSQGQARFEIFRHAKLKSPKSREIRSRGSAIRNAIKQNSTRTSTERQHQEQISEQDDDSLPGSDLVHEGHEDTTSSSLEYDADPPELSLIPAMFEGSSDPFNAQSITITPRVNQLITFIRDSYLTSLYLTPFMRKSTQGCPKEPTMATCLTVLGGPSAMTNWEHLQEGLASRGAASAWISSWVPTLLHFIDGEEAREWRLLGLKMRAHSIQELRRCLSDMDDPRGLSKPLVLHILWLFRADCITGDTTSATAHARILQPLIEGMEDPLQKTHLFTMMLFYDTELAVARMHRTLFNFRNWVGVRLGKFWEYAESQLPTISEDYKDFHASVRTTSVREAAVCLRRCLMIGRTPMRLRDPHSVRLGDVMYRWMATRTLSDMGILVDVYLDLVEVDNCYMGPGQRLTEAAIALTVLHILRKSMHSATINGIDARDLSHVIIPRLQSTLEQALKISTEEDLSTYREAHLWMFHAGAQFEQRVLGKSREPSIDLTTREQWFSDRFVIQARDLRLKTWPHIEKILERFVSSPFLGPKLESWFTKVADTIEMDTVSLVWV